MNTEEQAARIQRIEDRFAIQDLVIRYCMATDAGDRDTLLGLFSENARMGQLASGPAVVDMLHSVRSAYGRTIHTPEAHLVEFTDDDHATGVVLAHAELDIQGRSVHTAIRYYDTYERGDDGQWRFAERALKFAYALPVEEMADSLTGDKTIRWPGTDPASADEF